MKFRRFFIRRWAVILAVCVIVVALAFYITLLIVEKNSEMSQKLGTFFDVAKNLLIVLISVFASSILSAAFIERKNSDAISLDTLMEEVLPNDECLLAMDARSKEKLEKNLLGFHFDAKHEIHKDMLYDVRKTLFEENPRYYFESCSYKINCTIHEDKGFIEKHTVRALRIRSYDRKCQVPDFPFAKMTNKEVAGRPNLEMLSVKVDNRMLKREQYGFSESKVNQPVQRKNHYDTVHVCRYKNPLGLRSDKDTNVVIEYITRVDISDTNLCCRTSEHCKRFEVEFSIEGTQQYDIIGHGFGVIETADNTPNNITNGIAFKFDKWVFKNGGVSINFKKKEQ